MHTLYVLWFGYFKPSLYGNGPEALIQTVVYAAVAFAVYPPLHRWVTKEERAVNAEIHRAVHHIIKHHPDIPPLPPVAQTDASVKA